MASLLGQIGQIVTPSTPSSSTPSTPSTPSSVATGLPMRAWQLQVGETIYFNTRTCANPLPLPWSAWKVAFVWDDGDAILVRGKQLMTTMDLVVGYHVRRSAETYIDPYPGP